MKVSVLIPAYNCQDTIYTCIRSIIKQTYKDIEIVVVDDGSTDYTGIRLDQYKKHYNNQLKIIHEEHGGIAKTRNRLIQEAMGEYIFFIDADDWISSETIMDMVKVANEKAADVVVCGDDVQGVFGIRNGVYSQSCPNRREVLKYILRGRKINNNAWGKLMKKELWKNVEFPQDKIFEDIATIHKILIKSNKTVLIPAIYYHYNIPSLNSIMVELKPESIDVMLEAHLLQAKNILDFDPTLEPEVKKMLFRNKMSALWILARHCKLNKQSIKRVVSYKCMASKSEIKMNHH